MGLSFRLAREADLERLVAVHGSAFPDPRGHEARVRNFVRNALGSLEDLWVLEDGGIILAHAFLFPLEVHVGGAWVKAGGIATVGVAPEARGRGLGTRLLSHVHDASYARGDALTILYAYRRGFYSRLGYAPTSTYRRIRFHPAAVPWSLGHRVRAADHRDTGVLRECRVAWASRYTGVLARTDRAWQARLSDERRTWLVVEDDGGVVGYVAWSLEQSEPHAATTLHVSDLVGRTPDAERSLWALVGAQRDQVAEVRADLADDEPLLAALVDPDRARSGDAQVEHVLGEIAAGPLVRTTDVERVLEARGWPTSGAVTLAVGDRRLAVVVAEGRASCRETTAEPDALLEPAALPSIACGGLAPSHAARLGWLRTRDDRVLARLDALFALPPYFSPDPF